MVRVKLTRDGPFQPPVANASEINPSAGDVIEVSEAFADFLVSNGHAVETSEAVAESEMSASSASSEEPASEPDGAGPIEQPDADPSENAAWKKGRKKK